MFTITSSTKIAQMVPFQQTKWPPELSIELTIDLFLTSTLISQGSGEKSRTPGCSCLSRVWSLKDWCTLLASLEVILMYVEQTNSKMLLWDIKTLNNCIEGYVPVWRLGNFKHFIFNQRQKFGLQISRLESVIENYFLIYRPKSYVVYTVKNRLKTGFGATKAYV